jgi:RluA family pseudouridine synthase
MFEVSREHHGKSLLDFLDALAGPLDRRLVANAARRGEIELNGEPAGPSMTLRSGDVLKLEEPPESFVRAEHVPLEVLRSDDQLLVAIKPSGMPFDSSRSSSGRSAVEKLGVGDGPRPRPVHRLDKDTSGLLVAAMGREAEALWTARFRDGSARMEYLAIIRGSLADDEGEIDVPLSMRSRSDSRLTPDTRHGKPCTTRYRVEQSLRGFTWVRLWPVGTGRSHQIRAHLAALGHPALCDHAYGEDDRILLSQLKLSYRAKRGRPERPLLERPGLHAARFVWPEGSLEAPLPKDLEVVLSQLRRLRSLETADDPSSSEQAPDPEPGPEPDPEPETEQTRR